MTPSDRVLRQYLAGALEPPRHEEVVAALADPVVRGRLEVLRATTVAMPEPTFQLPPPWAVGPGVLSGSAAAGAVMDAEVADWVEVRVDVPEGMGQATVVVLERVSAAWTVLFPVAADEVVAAGDLPTNDAGSARMDVTITGTQPRRVAVVLLPGVPDFSLIDPWADLKGGLMDGTVHAVTFAVP